jgi:nucleotide-binding universal stress UspA family protein
MSAPSSLAPIVVVVDRTGAAAAVRYGASSALRTGRPLRLVHVAPSGDSWLQRVGQDALRIAMARADAELLGRVPVHSTSLQGSALPEISHAVASAAMVVLEQQPDAHRRPTGSVAASLASVTDTPVVVVPVDWVERRRGLVTLGLDPDAPDDVAITTAMTLARVRHAALRVVVAGATSRTDTEARLTRLGGDDCDLAVELPAGSPAEVLQLATESSDLLVLGRHRPLLPEGSRLGPVGRALLEHPGCPVLLTEPGHTHHRPGSPGTTRSEEESAMYAHVGDRIVVRSNHLGGSVRDGEVIEVEHADGRPPYLVRWSDTGHESLFFPGPDAYVDRVGPSYQPEYDLPAQVG